MTTPAAADLQSLAADPALANEAVSFATVMAFVDGKLDNKKLKAVLALAAKLGVKEDYRRRCRQARAGPPARRHRAHDPRQYGKHPRPSGRDRRQDAVVHACIATSPIRRSPRASMRSRNLPADDIRSRLRDILQGEQICVPRRADGAQLRVRGAARFLAHTRRLRHHAARRAAGVDLHGGDASQARDGGTRAAGDPELAPRHCAQRSGAAPPRARSIRRNSGTPGHAARRSRSICSVRPWISGRRRASRSRRCGRGSE